MKRLISLLFLVPFMVTAQVGTQKNGVTDKGIHFESLSWSQVLQKAKTENKYIFIDCYATWCGPCKRMDKSIYPVDSIGEFINSRFVSVKVQMDSSKKDSQTVQAWYADAHQLKSTYKIEAYPTFLFLGPDGKIIHRGLGYQKAGDFMILARKALDPSGQYYTLLQAYQSGKKDYAKMPYLAYCAKNFNESVLAFSIAADYLHNYLDKQSFKQICAPSNLEFIADFSNVLTSKDKVFDCLFHHPAMADSAEHDKDFSAWFVNYMIAQEEIIPLIAASKKHSTEPDWNQITRNIKNKFGSAYVDGNMAKAKIDWYHFKKDYKNYAKYIVKSLDLQNIRNNPNKVSVMYLNNAAWEVFQYSDNKEELQKAIDWSDLAIKKTPNASAACFDTKANLFYKLGKVGDAIVLERKAKEISPQSKEFAETLQKMEHGDPTWSTQ